MIKKIVIVVIILIILVVVFHPDRHAKYYDYVQLSQVVHELVPIKEEPNLSFCPKEFYVRLLETQSNINVGDINKFNDYVQPRNGGEYVPEDCRSPFKVAIVVPYRNRKRQLELFLNYIHAFLQRQKIHYWVFVSEQNDDLPFNRARMLNVGAYEAIKMNISCLILHDVDLFPLNLRNIYACFKRPRHMSSSIDTFRYNLPYLGLCGGAFAIQAKHFQRINGMSNEFYGWGGEDDDFFKRLQKENLTPYRFAPEMSTYTMLAHKKEKASENRWKKLEEYSIKKQAVDGLNSIPNYRVILEPLYTNIVVLTQ